MTWRRFIILLVGIQSAWAATFSVKGRVYSSDGQFARGAMVILTGGGSQFTAVSNDKTGEYSLTNVPEGEIWIKAQARGYEKLPAQRVILKADQTIDLGLLSDCDSCGAPGARRSGWGGEGMWTTIATLIFLISVCVIRWYNIARPGRARIRAKINNLHARFENETGKNLNADPSVAHLKALLDEAASAIEWSWTRSWKDALFWSVGEEIASWMRLHEFQRGMVAFMMTTPAGAEIIKARLQAVELDLLDIDKTHAKTLAGRIKEALESTTISSEALRALLMESLTYLNDELDTSYSELVSWQTKAVWLTGVGASIIITLAFMIGNTVLFIAGAAGGYLSRLSRSLKRADVPTDYGASWTTLFLSPIAGALSAWFGILLIVLLADARFNILGDAFRSVSWCAAVAPFTLAVAFALGFSERLFDGIVSALDERVDRDRDAAKKPHPPASSGITVPVPPAPVPPAPAAAPPGGSAAPANTAPAGAGEQAPAPHV
jgi:hypothetical protein